MKKDLDSVCKKHHYFPYSIKHFFFTCITIIIFTISLIILDQIFDFFYLNYGDKWHGPLLVFYDKHQYFFIFLSILSFLAVFFLGVSFQNRITERLKNLSVSIQAIGHGDYSQRVDLQDSPCELKELLQIFNDMAQKLDENRRTRKRFLAGIVHEINTPLTSIRGNLEAIQEGVFQADEKIGIILDETLYLQRLVNDIRDLSLAGTGQLQFNKKKTSINSAIEHAIQTIKPLFDEKSISIESKITELPEIDVDIDRFNQVLYNILTNALKYAEKDGKININGELEKIDGSLFVAIKVTDNGPGIGEEHLPYIFDLFYRVDKSRSKATGGTGIGLAIVKRIVEAHGGKVNAESTVGKGSTFSIYLPAFSE